MIHSIKIRNAVAGEASLLSALALRSKAYWGYSAQFMEACIEELQVTQNDIAINNSHYRVATIADSVVGFYTLENQSDEKIELGALFVEPTYIRRGVGTVLIKHAKKLALEVNARTVVIQGDPNAENFYIGAGAEKIGVRESVSIPGRFLPVFEIFLASQIIK